MSGSRTSLLIRKQSADACKFTTTSLPHHRCAPSTKHGWDCSSHGPTTCTPNGHNTAVHNRQNTAGVVRPHTDRTGLEHYNVASNIAVALSDRAIEMFRSPSRGHRLLNCRQLFEESEGVFRHIRTALLHAGPGTPAPRRARRGAARRGPRRAQVPNSR
jgi:hypothetical protein